MKVKTTYFCQNCGAQSPKWIGKCPSCNEWNTYVEEVIAKEAKSLTGRSTSTQRATKPLKLSEIEQSGDIRITLPDKELNRVLGWEFFALAVGSGAHETKHGIVNSKLDREIR